MYHLIYSIILFSHPTLNTSVAFSSQPKQADITDILEEYTGNGEDREKNRRGFTDMLGDFLFTFPAIKTAKAHRGTPEL